MPMQLDGELVVLDGVAYQQGAQGTCRRVEPSEKVRRLSSQASCCMHAGLIAWLRPGRQVQQALGLVTCLHHILERLS